MHGELIIHRQNVDKIAEQQQSKYLDLYTILPSEISMQLAEVALALGSIEDQVHKQFLVDFFIALNSCFHPLLWHGVIFLTCFTWLFKVQAKERDIQKTRVIKEEFNSRISDISEKLKSISTTLKEKATDIDQAKEETQVRLNGFTSLYSW